MNSSLSNQPWPKKKLALKEYSALALNRQLQQYDEWDEKWILARGKQMANLALTVWPRPDSP